MTDQNQTTAGPVPCFSIGEKNTKPDGEQLLDAQLLIGMVERYRPGTVEEARAWFADLLRKEISNVQS